MKNIFLTVAKQSATTLTLLVLIIAPFQPLIAQAQDAAGYNLNAQTPQQVIDTSNAANTDAINTSLDSAAAQPGATSGAVGVVGGSVGVSGTVPSPGAVTASQPGVTGSATGASSPSAPPGTSAGAPSINCSFFSNWSLCITNIVYVFTVGIGSGFAYIAAYFFDWTIALSLNSGAYALNFVSQGWTTARDIANMAFLFILLFIAFKIIFEAETSDTVHMLTMVIVVALLVNFSFFFTRLAIDAGNILSIQFYNAIQAPSISATAATTGISSTGNASLLNNALGSGNQKDLTASIMGMLNLQGLFSTQAFNNWYAPGGNPSAGPNFMVVVISLSFLYVAAGIMFWLLTVAFVTNGVKFLFRIVILWFLIIASPLAFVARAVPKLEKYYHQWQEALISHSFYPAAFMFIFLILTNFSNQMGNSNNLTNGLFNGLSAANGTSPVAAIAIVAANIFIRLGFVIAMLYIGMEAAKKVGVLGADMANHAGNWVGGRMIGAYGATGRNTLGWGAYKVAQSSTLRKLENRPDGWGVLGRGLRGTLGTVGRASFDVRGVPGTKSILKDTGKAQKGGYESALKERTKEIEKKAKALEPSEGQKMVAEEQAKAETKYEIYKPVHEKNIASSKERIEEINDDINDLKGTPDSSGKIKILRAQKQAHKTNMQASTRKLEKLEEAKNKRAQEISGEGLSKKYAADVLATPNIRNLWIPFRSSKEAAAKVRKGKTDVEKIADAVKEAAKEDKETAEKEEPKKDAH